MSAGEWVGLIGGVGGGVLLTVSIIILSMFARWASEKKDTAVDALDEARKSLTDAADANRVLTQNNDQLASDLALEKQSVDVVNGKLTRLQERFDAFVQSVGDKVKPSDALALASGALHELAVDGVPAPMPQTASTATATGGDGKAGGAVPRSAPSPAKH